MIIYGTREKAFIDNKQEASNCPYCDQEYTLVSGHIVRYFHIFWIPIFPFKDNLFSYCSHCKNTKHENEMSLEDRFKIKQRVHNRKPIWLFSGLIIIGTFLCFTLIAALKEKSQTIEYLNTPLIGDIYTVKVKNESEKGYTLYRITNIKSDSITFELNDYYATSSSKISNLKKEHGNDYTEKITLHKNDIDSMNKEGSIRDIERESND